MQISKTYRDNHDLARQVYAFASISRTPFNEGAVRYAGYHRGRGCPAH